jgi:tetratricopeptide (TPR) repeat protein
MTDRIHFLPSQFILPALLLLCAQFVCARSDEPHWIRISTSHFSVVTDADEQKGRDALVRFEQMRAAFGQLLARDRINMPEPLDLIALRSDEEYSKVVPNRPGPAIADGFFIPGEDRNYFVLNLSKEDNWRAISYDFAQVYLNYNYPPTQAWFDEGFAQYFASLRLDNKQGQIGGDPESFTELLDASSWLAIPDLFATGHEPSASHESSHHTVFSAQSWIVMHYLLNQNKLPETGTYFDLVQNQQLPIEQAIQKAYGMTSVQFGQAVKDYFHALAQRSQPAEKGGQPAAGNQFPAVSAADQIGSSTEKLPEAEGQSLLAEMSLRLPEHRAQSMQELEAITGQLKTDNVIARRGLAWAHMEKKEFDRAVEELNQGEELTPKDPWLHYYSALIRHSALQTGGQRTEGLPNMMQDLRLVLNWDAEFAEARSMLAMAELEGGGVHAAMDSMRAAIQLNPRNQSYLLNMAQIYMAAKNWDAATALLERLKSSPDSQVAKSAREQLEGLPMLKKYGVPPQAASKPQPETEKQTPQTSEEASADHPEQPPPQLQPDKRAIKFLKGKLIAVDCSQAPSAVLTLSAGARVLKLRAENYKSLTLIGADEFSCEWKSRPVAVNYRAGGKADGDLVSVELE